MIYLPLRKAKNEKMTKAKMEIKLKITRVLALVAFGFFLGSIVLPYYKLDNGGEATGFYLGHFWYAIVVVPIVFFFLIKHSTVIKWLIVPFLLFSFYVNYTDMRFMRSLRIDGYDVINFSIGFYAFCLCNLLFLNALLLKFFVPISQKNSETELLDDFLSQSFELKNE